MIYVPHSTSTNKTILDQLLYLSIQSRLKQHEATQRLSSCRSKKEKHKKAVESIVTGILSSHRSYMKSNHNMDSQFRQRLDLCQLTHTVFGRYDAAQMNDPSTTTWRKIQHSTYSDLYQAQPLASHCRLHRSLICTLCPTLPSPPTIHSSSDNSYHTMTTTTTTTTTATTCQPSSALIHAIPLFLKTSADLLRLALDERQQRNNNKVPMIALAGEKVMGGGLPQAWYELFLDLMTQAAIEAYLCDGQVGMESIVDIFSHGYVEDEDEPDPTLLDDDDNDDIDDDEDSDDDYCPDATLTAADHHLLFPKTRSMFLFKSQVWQREQEFLTAGDGVNLQDHFQQLAQTYPVTSFDLSMRNFIQRILNTMDIPVLEKDKSTRQPFFSSSLTGFLDISADGSLFMPETTLDDDSSSLAPGSSSKRRLSLDATFSSPFKKQKI